MKSFIIAAATLSACLSSQASLAAEYATITLERPLNVSADAAWKQIMPFCVSATRRGLACDLVNGNGTDIGSVRSLNHGQTTEIMVGRSKYSVTYTFPAPNPTAFHGTYELVPEGPKKSKLVRTIFWDQSSLDTAEAKAADKAARTKNLTDIIDGMVKMVESKAP